MYRLYTRLSNYKYIITNMCNNLLYTLKCICKNNNCTNIN